MKDVEIILEYKLFSIKLLGKILTKKGLGETNTWKKTLNVKTSDILWVFFKIVFYK